MQLINKGQNNYLVFTLYEKQTLTVPYFLFEFTSKLTKNPVYFIAADVSSYPTRFNKFLITETSGSQIPTSGTIELEEGEHDYTIYEQTSSSNLNPVLATGIVEIGMVKVQDTAPTFKTYDSQDKTYKAYDG
jgi:hypothetical protein